MDRQCVQGPPGAQAVPYTHTAAVLGAPLRSQFFGVYPNPEKAGRWCAEYFRDHRKVTVGGDYSDEETAARDYDIAVLAEPVIVVRQRAID